jgi:hypothetical protein
MILVEDLVWFTTAEYISGLDLDTSWCVSQIISWRLKALTAQEGQMNVFQGVNMWHLYSLCSEQCIVHRLHKYVFTVWYTVNRDFREHFIFVNSGSANTGSANRTAQWTISPMFLPWVSWVKCFINKFYLGTHVNLVWRHHKQIAKLLYSITRVLRF